MATYRLATQSFALSLNLKGIKQIMQQCMFLIYCIIQRSLNIHRAHVSPAFRSLSFSAFLSPWDTTSGLEFAKEIFLVSRITASLLKMQHFIILYENHVLKKGSSYILNKYFFFLLTWRSMLCDSRYISTVTNKVNKLS